MMIQLLRDMAGTHGLGRAGTIVEVPIKRARNLIRGGLAMEAFVIQPLQDMAAGPEPENGGTENDDITFLGMCEEYRRFFTGFLFDPVTEVAKFIAGYIIYISSDDFDVVYVVTEGKDLFSFVASVFAFEFLEFTRNVL